MNIIFWTQYCKKITIINLRVSCLLLATVLFAGCATSAPDKVYQNPFGSWHTKIQTQSGTWLPHGVMTFSDKTKATYGFHNGRILLDEVDNQGRWRGIWVEDSWGTVHCSNEIDGSSTWGEAILQFDETYNTYKGTWDKCGDGKRNSWVGTRL